MFCQSFSVIMFSSQIVYGIFFMKKIEIYTVVHTSVLNVEKVSTVPNLALGAVEIVSSWTPKFYIYNQKKLTLTKNPDCSPFR